MQNKTPRKTEKEKTTELRCNVPSTFMAKLLAIQKIKGLKNTGETVVFLSTEKLDSEFKSI
jgi:hypothetical protein